MPDSPHTIFLVDDDDAIRSSLSRALKTRGFDVEAHASAFSFLESFDGSRDGCLILDYGMPGMNGLELQERLNTLGHDLSIIFITGHGGVPESVQAIKGGAVDFLEKPFSQAMLIERLETACAQIRESRRRSADARARHARIDRLTPREREIVDHIVTHPSEISSKAIAARLGVSPRTVDHHRARILEKLGASSLVEVLAMATR